MSITASIVPWRRRLRGWRSQGFVIIAGAALPRVRVMRSQINYRGRRDVRGRYHVGRGQF